MWQDKYHVTNFYEYLVKMAVIICTETLTLYGSTKIMLPIFMSKLHLKNLHFRVWLEHLCALLVFGKIMQQLNEIEETGIKHNFIYK